MEIAQLCRTKFPRYFAAYFEIFSALQHSYLFIYLLFVYCIYIYIFIYLIVFIPRLLAEPMVGKHTIRQTTDWRWSQSDKVLSGRAMNASGGDIQPSLWDNSPPLRTGQHWCSSLPRKDSLSHTEVQEYSGDVKRCDIVGVWVGFTQHWFK